MKEEDDDDPFGSLTRFSLIPASQSNLLHSVPFARQHEHFPTNNNTESQPEAAKVFDKMPVSKIVKKKKVLSLSEEGFSVGTQTEDLSDDEMRVRKGLLLEKKDRFLTGLEGSKRVLGGGDNVFDEMRVRKAIKIESLGNKARVLTGSEVVDLGGGKVGMRNQEVKMGIEVIDLEEDCELGEKSKMGPDEDTSTRVLDLDANETCDDLLPIRNAEAEVRKNPSADVGKGKDLTTRNLVGKGGLNEGDEVCRDEFRGFREKGIGGIDNGNCVSLKDDKNRQKDQGNSEGRELYENLSHRNKEIAKALNKVGEPRRDANRGSSEKGIEEINRREENNVVSSVGGSRKACGDEPSRDVIRVCSSKETNTSKGNNNHREGKSQARKLPSSLRTLAETGIRKTFASHCERNKKAVEKNSCEKETSEPVSQKSKDFVHELLSSVGGETTNDQIMKNLLDGLDLIIGGQKETVDNASDGEVDILETAMKMGMVFPRPRWWPDEGFDDE